MVVRQGQVERRPNLYRLCGHGHRSKASTLLGPRPNMVCSVMSHALLESSPVYYERVLCSGCMPGALYFSVTIRRCKVGGGNTRWRSAFRKSVFTTHLYSNISQDKTVSFTARMEWRSHELFPLIVASEAEKARLHDNAGSAPGQPCSLFFVLENFHMVKSNWENRSKWN